MKKSFFIWLVSLVFLVTLLEGCQAIRIRMEKRSEAMPSEHKAHADMSGTGFLNRCHEHLERAKNLRGELVQRERKKPFLLSLKVYNEILMEADTALSQASLLSQTHPDTEVRKEALACEQEMSSFITELSLDKDVYEVLKSGDGTDLPHSARRMLEHSLRDFKRAGVDKDDETRQKIKDLKSDLVTIGQKFGENIRDDKLYIRLKDPSDLKGLPADYIESHKPGPDGLISISTDYPDYIPFMKYADNDQLRKELRFKYLNRGQRNESVLKSMIESRAQLAKMLGYSSYADYVAEDKMIKNAHSIHEFIAKISDMAKSGADREYQTLLEFKKRMEPQATEISGWESAYLEEKFKKEKFAFDSQEARAYFPFERVRDGVLKVTSELFNVSYSPVPDAKVWHDSVLTYDVYDDSGKLGRIFLDLHPREGKYKHAAQFTVVSGVKDIQYPEGALVCNFPDPSLGSALMEHRQVVTLFHEFGHLLHHIFAGKQDYIAFSGVATEWDFVEAPSQLLEEWAWSHQVLEKFAIHHETQQPISPELVQTMRHADEFGKALSARQQMFYAALSLNYFNKDPESLDLLGELKSLQAQYSYFPYEEGTHFYDSFGHLDGYSALYYTYMWSLSIAKDLWQPFKEQGLMNKEIAQRYRDLILRPGGAKDAAELVTDFLGRPFKFDAFEHWLRSEARVASNPPS